MAIWGHHLSLLHPERVRDRRNFNNTALRWPGGGMFYVTECEKGVCSFVKTDKSKSSNITANNQTDNRCSCDVSVSSGQTLKIKGSPAVKPSPNYCAEITLVVRMFKSSLTYVKGCEQYSLNMVTMVSNTTFAWTETSRY